MTYRNVKHKFRAKPTVSDGIRFDSKKEAAHYETLKQLQRCGTLLFFLRQVPFHLPGGVTYRCDFAEFYEDGEVVFTDVKGHRTESYKAKKRQVEAIYPVTIMEV